MPKININGHVRDMTEEEVAEMERMQAEMPEMPLTTDERLDKIQATVDGIVKSLSALLGKI